VRSISNLTVHNTVALEKRNSYPRSTQEIQTMKLLRVAGVLWWVTVSSLYRDAGSKKGSTYSQNTDPIAPLDEATCGRTLRGRWQPACWDRAETAAPVLYKGLTLRASASSNFDFLALLADAIAWPEFSPRGERIVTYSDDNNRARLAFHRPRAGTGKNDAAAGWASFIVRDNGTRDGSLP
jgi:hypothetical protein